MDACTRTTRGGRASGSWLRCRDTMCAVVTRWMVVTTTSSVVGSRPEWPVVALVSSDISALPPRATSAAPSHLPPRPSYFPFPGTLQEERPKIHTLAMRQWDMC